MIIKASTSIAAALMGAVLAVSSGASASTLLIEAGGGGGEGVGLAARSGGGLGGGGSYISPLMTLLGSASGVNGTPHGSANGFVHIGDELFTYTGAVQNYVIPVSGFYDIIAVGAQGRGGYGSLMSGLGNFNAGTDLEISVGSNGAGSFVFEPGAVPEPGVWAMLILGVAMIGIAARRRNAGVALTA